MESKWEFVGIETNIERKTKYILNYTLLFDLCFYLSRMLINLLGFEYMQWINKSVLLISIVTIVIGIIQIIIKSKKRKLKSFLITIMIIFTIIFAIFWKIPLLMYLAHFPPEHIVKKEDTEMVGYVHGFLHTSVNYYEYKNLFFRGNKRICIEEYGKGSFDPLEDKDGNEHEPIITIYYDKKGNIIKEVKGEGYDTYEW